MTQDGKPIGARVISFLTEDRMRQYQNHHAIPTTENKAAISIQPSTEPPLLTAIKTNSKDFEHYLNEAYFSEMLAYFGYQRHFGKIVKVEGKIVKVVSLTDCYNYTVDLFKDDPDIDKGIKGKLFPKLDQLTKHLKSLESFDGEFLEDDKDHCYLPYQNCVLDISSKQLNKLPYNEIDKYIWEHQIIGRDYREVSAEEAHQHDWYKFLCHTCCKPGNPAALDAKRLEALLSAIGYGIHRYKESCRPAMLVFCDEQTPGQNNDGGTGKSRIVQSIERMNRRFVKEDGRRLEKSPFNFSDVGADTDVLFIDDMELSSYPVSNLYSMLTGAWMLREMYKPQRELPEKEAPKIILTTNNSAKLGTDSSDLRRRMDIQLKHYYSNEYTPVDEFSRMFWDEWDANDWAMFDAIQIEAVQISLRHYVARNGLPKYPNSIITDSLRCEITPELDEFLDLKTEDQIVKAGIITIPIPIWRTEFNSKHHKNISSQDFKDRIHKYHRLKLEGIYEKPYDKKIKHKGTTTNALIVEPKPAYAASVTPPQATATARLASSPGSKVDKVPKLPVKADGKAKGRAVSRKTRNSVAK